MAARTDSLASLSRRLHNPLSTVMTSGDRQGAGGEDQRNALSAAGAPPPLEVQATQAGPGVEQCQRTATSRPAGSRAAAGPASSAPRVPGTLCHPTWLLLWTREQLSIDLRGPGLPTGWTLLRECLIFLQTTGRCDQGPLSGTFTTLFSRTKPLALKCPSGYQALCSGVGTCHVLTLSSLSFQGTCGSLTQASPRPLLLSTQHRTMVVSNPEHP